MKSRDSRAGLVKSLGNRLWECERVCMRTLREMKPSEACNKRDQFFWFRMPCSNLLLSMVFVCVCVLDRVLKAWQACSLALLVFR